MCFYSIFLFFFSLHNITEVLYFRFVFFPSSLLQKFFICCFPFSLLQTKIFQSRSSAMATQPFRIGQLLYYFLRLFSLCLCPFDAHTQEFLFWFTIHSNSFYSDVSFHKEKKVQFANSVWETNLEGDLIHAKEI